MVPKHAMDLFIEKSQVEICVLLTIKVHSSMQSSVYRPTVYDAPSVTLFKFTHFTDNHDNAGHGVIVLVQWFDNYIE